MTTARQNVDAVIVGAGPIGLAAAHALVAHGRSVVVVDAATHVGGTARGSAGMVVPSMITPQAWPGAITEFVHAMAARRTGVSIVPTLRASELSALWRFARSTRIALERRPVILRAMAALAQESSAMIDEWVERYGVECAFNQRGVLEVFNDERRFERAVAAADALAPYGCRPVTLDSATARSVEPALSQGLAGAIHHTTDANLDPTAFLQALGRTVEDAGATLRLGTRVRRIDRQPDGTMNVEAELLSLHAHSVLVATGTGTPALPGPAGHLPILRARGYSVTAAATRAPNIPLLFADDHVAIAPLGGRLRISGGFQIGGRSERVSARTIDRLLRSARSVAAFDIDVDTLEPWAGFRPLSADGLPIIGRVPGCEGLFVATGHSMVGLSFAPSTGRAVAQLMIGAAPSVDLSIFDPNRFTRS